MSPPSPPGGGRTFFKTKKPRFAGLFSYPTDTISGQMEIGGVNREVFTDKSSRITTCSRSMKAIGRRHT
jgi:hypothetical protein